MERLEDRPEHVLEDSLLPINVLEANQEKQPRMNVSKYRAYYMHITSKIVTSCFECPNEAKYAYSRARTLEGLVLMEKSTRLRHAGSARSKTPRSDS